MPRRLLWFTALACLIVIAVLLPRIHYTIFRPRLTPTQQRILEQAEVGLSVYATRSVTARSLSAEARHLTRRAVFVPGVGAFPIGKRTPAPISVAVHPEDVASTIASYNHRQDLVLFVEPKCDSLSHTTLGLIYGHELRHRRDYVAHIYRDGDAPMSEPRLTTELRARQTVLRILSEYTDARWDSAVVQHNRIYRRQSATWRRERPLSKAWFKTDEDWMRHEFGRLTPSDHSYLSAQFKFDGALRLALPDSAITSADSLRRHLATLRAF